MSANPRPVHAPEPKRRDPLSGLPYGTTTALECLAYTRHCLESEIWFMETKGYEAAYWDRRSNTRNDELARMRGRLIRTEERIARYLENGIDRVVPMVPWSNG